MGLQQNKMSKSRIRRRKAANRYQGLQTNTCPRCGAAKLPHCACMSCGYYKDQQVLSIEA